MGLHTEGSSQDNVTNSPHQFFPSVKFDSLSKYLVALGWWGLSRAYKFSHPLLYYQWYIRMETTLRLLLTMAFIHKYGDDPEWGGWMASPSQWTWVWKPKLHEIKDRGSLACSSWVTKGWTWLSIWTITTKLWSDESILGLKHWMKAHSEGKKHISSVSRTSQPLKGRQP